MGPELLGKVGLELLGKVGLGLLVSWALSCQVKGVDPELLGKMGLKWGQRREKAENSQFQGARAV